VYFAARIVSLSELLLHHADCASRSLLGAERYVRSGMLHQQEGSLLHLTDCYPDCCMARLTVILLTDSAWLLGFPQIYLWFHAKRAGADS